MNIILSEFLRVKHSLRMGVRSLQGPGSRLVYVGDVFIDLSNVLLQKRKNPWLRLRPWHFLQIHLETLLTLAPWVDDFCPRSQEKYSLCREYLRGKYHCTVDLLFDWFGISCMTIDNFCFYLQNRLIQISSTGGQWYIDTSLFSIPWFMCSLPIRSGDRTPNFANVNCP
jgi:hypothetical protein